MSAETTIVTARVSLQCRVDEIPDNTNRPRHEKKQKHDQWDCKTRNISLCEWNWRFETAKSVLCAGETLSGGTYYGDVIGGDWDCATMVAVNEDMFNER
jgi:hypothetical protein